KLPNGSVLVAGGESHQCNSFNGCSFSGVTNTTELYNPATGTWSYTGNLSFRGYHTATLLPNGQVLVAGGVRPGFTSVNSAEIYDPATGNWSSTANLNVPRSFHTATLLSNGKVLVAGGESGNDLSNSKLAELYAGTSLVSNSIDDPQFFVRQHYLDFLNREPDADGLAFWTNEIDICGGNPQCVEVKRINVSAAYFLSIEFRNTGYFVYRIYESSFGNLPDPPAPFTLSEFLPDAQQTGQ